MKQTQPFLQLSTPILYTVYSLCVNVAHCSLSVQIVFEQVLQSAPCFAAHSTQCFSILIASVQCVCSCFISCSESTCHSFVSFCSYFCVKWCVTKHNSNIGTITTITCFSSLSCVQAWNVSVLCCVCALECLAL